MLVRVSRLCSLFVVMLMCSAIPIKTEPLFTGSEAVPSDAVVLFNGKDLNGWVSVGSGKTAEWTVRDGYMEVLPGKGDISTVSTFSDCQLHIEFMVPLMPDQKGQNRGNSGVYLQASYEVQVLDSYGLQSQSSDCGGIYGVAAPLVNACRPPEHWQSYDVFFYAPQFDQEGRRISAARISVIHNGVWIHDNVSLPTSTTSAAQLSPKKQGPLMLQDHRCQVRYRNIWIRPLN